MIIFCLEFKIFSFDIFQKENSPGKGHAIFFIIFPMVIGYEETAAKKKLYIYIYIYMYVLLDVLVCSISEYFYAVFRIMTSPQSEPK